MVVVAVWVVVEVAVWVVVGVAIVVGVVVGVAIVVVVVVAFGVAVGVAIVVGVEVGVANGIAVAGGGAVTDADKCRRNGWTVGDRLIGVDGQGTDVIEITAIGRENVLAVPISGPAADARRSESLWSLRYRDWRKAGT